MSNTMKVRVKDEDISKTHYAYQLRGQILTVLRFPDDQGFHTIMPDKGKCIHNSQFEPYPLLFQPESGMLFKTTAGNFGVFIQKGDSLLMVFYGTSGYNIYHPDLLTSYIQAIYNPPYKDSLEPSKCKSYTIKSHHIVWPPKPTQTEVFFHDGAKAIVTAKEVTFIGAGGSVPIEKLKEMVAEAEKLK